MCFKYVQYSICSVLVIDNLLVRGLAAILFVIDSIYILHNLVIEGVLMQQMHLQFVFLTVVDCED